MNDSAAWESDIRILVVDDEEAVVRPLLRGLTIAGFTVHFTADSHDALNLLSRALDDYPFHALLTDLQMPRMRGDELLRRAHSKDPDLVVILVTALGDVDMAVQCMRQGASDYVTKSFQIADIVVRLRSDLDKRRMALQIRQDKALLEERVRERTAQLESQYVRALESLGCAVEAKDAYTQEHSDRVCKLARALVERLFPDDPVRRHQIETAARLHDIGKIGVPEAIINKPGRLSPEEFRRIQQHPCIGSDILVPLIRDKEVLAIVRHHHEWWDGSGYPDGLAGEEIPLGARLLSVVDAYDAMTTRRPYRAPMSGERVLEILREGAGRQWDAQIVDAFLAMVEEVVSEADIGIFSLPESVV